MQGPFFHLFCPLPLNKTARGRKPCWGRKENDRWTKTAALSPAKIPLSRFWGIGKPLREASFAIERGQGREYPRNCEDYFASIWGPEITSKGLRNKPEPCRPSCVPKEFRRRQDELANPLSRKVRKLPTMPNWFGLMTLWGRHSKPVGAISIGLLLMKHCHSPFLLLVSLRLL